MIRAAVCGCLALAGVSLFVSAAEARTERRVALVIGNSEYRNTPSLANPVNDAEDLATALERLGFSVILERNLNKRGMEGAIARFARLAQDADAAFFFYAGHGMQHRGGNYLMPVDAKLEDAFSLNFELTRIDDVLFGLERARGVKVLVLDACRNNPLLERFTRTAASRDLIATRGVGKIEATRGMVVAYSTQVNQVAVDGSERNSPFADALIRQLDEPGLEISTVFRRVAVEVNRATDGRQLPEFSVSLVGDFYLNTRDTDLQAWAGVRDSNDPGRLRDFISQYPKSVLVADARQRLDLLQREQAERERREGERLAREHAEQAERRRFADERLAREQAERERLAKEQREADGARRQEALRAEQERQRIADANAAREKAADDPAPPTTLAALTPWTDKARPDEKPALSGGALVREIKNELRRLGCYRGRADDKWHTRETRASVQKLARCAKLEGLPSAPEPDFLNTIRSKPAGICACEEDRAKTVKPSKRAKIEPASPAPRTTAPTRDTTTRDRKGRNATRESFELSGKGTIRTGMSVVLTARDGRKMTCIGGSIQPHVPRRCTWH
jgi:uncharacterized caspase-like protein